MNGDWYWPVAQHLGRGLLVTLWVSGLSVVFATLLGVLLGLCSQSRRRWVTIPVRCYVELFRGVPSLLTLLFVFFALPQFGLPTGAIAASVVGLGLWAAAGIAEMARGALVSVSPRQAQGARALGMGALQALLHVTLPQAVRRFLPSYVGQLTVLVQASVLTSVVGVTDLLGSARQMIERLAYVSDSSHAVAIYAAVLAVFFVVCYPLMFASDWLARRFRT